MTEDASRPAQAAIRTALGAIFVSLELSRRTWLITSLSPGGGEKMSKHAVPAGEVSGLLRRFAELRRKAAARTGRDFPIIVIQEAGLDGFWIHRVLQSEGIESYVVDAASILTSRRRRRAKTDRIDGETLVRTLMAYKRGEPRVCSMARAPTTQEEDRRRVCRERRTLVGERVRHVNRIKGLLSAQGVFGYEPLRKGRRERRDDAAISLPVDQSAKGHLRVQGAGARLRTCPDRPKHGRAAPASVSRAKPVRPSVGSGRRRADAPGIPRNPRVSWRENRPAVAVFSGRPCRGPQVVVLSVTAHHT